MKGSAHGYDARQRNPLPHPGHDAQGLRQDSRDPPTRTYDERFDLPLPVRLLFVAIVGFGTTGTSILIYGLVANHFPTRMRGAAVAWAAGFGRLGVPRHGVGVRRVGLM